MTKPARQLEFICSHCARRVSLNKKLIGSRFRNHCPACLWSRHFGQKKVKLSCRGDMEPLGLVFKSEGKNKGRYSHRGELMLVHRCLNCGQISYNRLAADDNPRVVWQLYERSLSLPPQGSLPPDRPLAGPDDKQEVNNQLFGKQ